MTTINATAAVSDIRILSEADGLTRAAQVAAAAEVEARRLEVALRGAHRAALLWAEVAAGRMTIDSFVEHDADDFVVCVVSPYGRRLARKVPSPDFPGEWETVCFYSGFPL
jgi:hypothetical protein